MGREKNSTLFLFLSGTSGTPLEWPIRAFSLSLLCVSCLLPSTFLSSSPSLSRFPSLCSLTHFLLRFPSGSIHYSPFSLIILSFHSPPYRHLLFFHFPPSLYSCSPFSSVHPSNPFQHSRVLQKSNRPFASSLHATRVPPASTRSTASNSRYGNLVSRSHAQPRSTVLKSCLPRLEP